MVEDVIKYDSLVNKILDNIEVITNEIMQFWSKIKAKKIDEKIYENSEVISELIKKTNTIFQEIDNTLSFKSLEFLKLYTNFIEDIVNNEDEGLELRDKITNLIHDISQNIVVKYDIIFSSFEEMENVGTVIISGQIVDTCRIMAVNSNICKMLNYDKNELISKNVNSIIPPYIAEYHNGFVLKYIETSKKSILDTIKIAFTILSNGFLTPIGLLTKVIPKLDQGIRFIGLIREINKAHKFYHTTEETKYSPITLIIAKEDGVIVSINIEVIIY